MNYLVDTSVWIDFIKGQDNQPVKFLHNLLEHNKTVGLTALIYQEILQGAESELKFKQFKEYFNQLPCYYPKHSINSYADAAQIYCTCRRKGLTIRSTVDCLIAQIAIENELILLHNDKDYAHIANVFPVLKCWQDTN